MVSMLVPPPFYALPPMLISTLLNAISNTSFNSFILFFLIVIFKICIEWRLLFRGLFYSLAKFVALHFSFHGHIYTRKNLCRRISFSDANDDLCVRTFRFKFVHISSIIHLYIFRLTWVLGSIRWVVGDEFIVKSISKCHILPCGGDEIHFL